MKIIPDHLQTAALEFARACAASRTHAEIARNCLSVYGDHGPLVSGVIRGHFPDEQKAILRSLARAVTVHSELAHALRPRRVHRATMRALAAHVANRDGSGRYGPQPTAYRPDVLDLSGICAFRIATRSAQS